MQRTDEEEYESLREELIGHYQRELAYIYTYHDRPPIEYYAPVKDVVTRLIPQLNGREFDSVLAECWATAWYREPLCHPDTRYIKG